jgi:hypothetical protein
LQVRKEATQTQPSWLNETFLVELDT